MGTTVSSLLKQIRDENGIRFATTNKVVLITDPHMLVACMENVILKSVSYHIGSILNTFRNKDVHIESLRIPYNNIWVEGSNDNNNKYEKDCASHYVTGYLISTINDVVDESGDDAPGIHIQTFVRNDLDKIWHFKGGFSCFIKDDQPKIQMLSDDYSTVIYSNVFKMAHVVTNKESTIKHGLPDMPTDSMNESWNVISSFLSVLNSKNHKVIEHVTPSSVNAKRARKGKCIIDSYWTLEVCNDVTECCESKNGTHVSPRLHTRAGHFRTYKSGKRIWVSPCMVGDVMLGTVGKDYKLKIN